MALKLEKKNSIIRKNKKMGEKKKVKKVGVNVTMTDTCQRVASPLFVGSPSLLVLINVVAVQVAHARHRPNHPGLQPENQ